MSDVPTLDTEYDLVNEIAGMIWNGFGEKSKQYEPAPFALAGEVIAAVRRHVAPAPAAPDAGLRDRMIDAMGEHVQHLMGGIYEVDLEAAADAIIAILPPRIDGVTVNDLHALDRILKYMRPFDPHTVYANEPGFYICDDLDRITKLRAMLGREGV